MQSNKKSHQFAFKLNKRIAAYGVGVLALLVTLFGGWYGYLYASTPGHIREPEIEHYHFRTQIVVDGKVVDFSKKEFQQDYDSGSCSAEISDTPIDFHDDMDQMTHVHWDGMTGGELLKYFGWNFIGGNDSTLGRRYDNGMMSMRTVDRYGDLLPAIPENANFYVYTGDASKYQQKSWGDFLEQDLEDFFGKKSKLDQSEQASLFDKLFFNTAYAHGDMMDGHGEDTDKSEEELQAINNLIGNVVIFVQEEEPSKAQIRERFNNLVPLHESTCGG